MLGEVEPISGTALVLALISTSLFFGFATQDFLVSAIAILLLAIAATFEIKDHDFAQENKYLIYIWISTFFVILVYWEFIFCQEKPFRFCSLLLG